MYKFKYQNVQGNDLHGFGTVLLAVRCGRDLMVPGYWSLQMG